VEKGLKTVSYDIIGSLEVAEVGYRKGDSKDEAIARLPESLRGRPFKLRAHMIKVIDAMNAQTSPSEDPEAVAIQRVFYNEWKVLPEYVIRTPSGKEEIMPIFRGSSGVVVLALTEENNVALVNQWRFRPE